MLVSEELAHACVSGVSGTNSMQGHLYLYWPTYLQAACCKRALTLQLMA